MKLFLKNQLLAALLPCMVLLLHTQGRAQSNKVAHAELKTDKKENAIRWMGFDEAVQLSKKHPKKIFIDVFTSWCGWCKRMDATTYTDKDIINLINKYYYAVRLDAETKDTFHFNNHLFYNAAPGQRGSVNELASSLLDGKLEYPTTVYLDEKVNRLTYAAGYMSAADLKTVLLYFAENKYKTLTFDAYKKTLTENSAK